MTISNSERSAIAAGFYWTGAALIIAGAAIAAGWAGGLIAAGASMVVFTILNTR